jgi:hypothetical protein
MFTTKKKELFSVPTKSSKATSTGSNAFVHEGLKKSSESLSGNGALKYSTTGDDFVDQFGSTGQFRAIRPYAEIARDMNVLYTQNPELAVKFTLYLRTISRKVQLFDGDKTEKVQKGTGLKHESIMRMIWLNVNHNETFWKNIKLFISVGSWKDIFVMLQTDLSFNGWEGRVLDWDNFASLIMSGLENPNTVDLVKKYLPQIKSRSNCTTVEAQANTTIGKFLVSKIFGVKSDNYATYKQYRKLKASGEAHQWQQLISQRLFDQIDFASVHGRALSGLVSSKFLSNNNLENTYEDWISAQPVAKYTGYVHELAMKIGSPNGGNNYWLSGSNATTLKPYQKHTINKQYDGLVKLAKDNVNLNSGLLVVRDTSGSMTSNIKGQEISAYDVAKALGIFFGDMLEGHFANSWVEFNRTAKMHTYKEDNFVDKWLGDASSIIGNTNFLSVANLFANIKSKGVTESEFPTGIVCISDGEFNRAKDRLTTNFEAFRDILTAAGFSKEYVKNFQLILWDIPNSYYGRDTTQFETYGDTENVFYLSGYDGSILGFLLGDADEDGKVKSTPKTPEELFQAAMDQEVLNLVTV